MLLIILFSEQIVGVAVSLLLPGAVTLLEARYLYYLDSTIPQAARIEYSLL